MAIQQNFPDEGPTLNLNFAGSRTLDPRITFTRTSSATYMGSDGLIKIASVNSPRFDHSYNPATGEIESLGLLVEEARTNSVRRSQELDESSVWSKTNVGITTNATIAPDGTLSAEKLIDDTSVNTQHWLRIRCTGITTNTFVTASTFFKFDPTNLSARGMSLVVTDAETGGSTYSAINIKANGTFTVPTPNFPNTTGGLISLSNGWYRAHVTFTNANISELSLRLQLFQDSNNNVVYTGDGSSGIFVWGAQLEVGAFPTSYIPTSGSTATRTLDSITMVGTNFSSWYRQGEGTFYINGRSYSPAFQRSLGASIFNSSSPTQDRISIRMGNIFIQDQGINQFANANPNTIPTENSQYKVCLSFKGDDVVSQFNSVSTTDTSATIPTNLNTMNIGLVEASNTLTTNGTISQLTYYPKRLPNQQLINLTK